MFEFVFPGLAPLTTPILTLPTTQMMVGPGSPPSFLLWSEIQSLKQVKDENGSIDPVIEK